MSAYDFSHEDDQQEYRPTGPVPAGSIVLVELHVMEPNPQYAAQDDPLVSITRNGLRQLYVECEVIDGRYRGVQWRQTLTLPAGLQRGLSMTDGQATSCRIGGAMLKAILQAANRPASVQNMKAFHGLRFPVKVKINSREQTSKTGNTYWVNEIASVITPDKQEYADVRDLRELINPDGAVTGLKNSKKPEIASRETPFDEVPF